MQIHEVGSQGGVYYLALEFVSGGSLDRHLAGTPQEPRAAAQLIETLARAVHPAHQRGIMYRDLKPANILFANRGLGAGDSEDGLPLVPAPSPLFPKITDFGLAKRLEPGDIHTRAA